jgi:hypothetical protein
MRFLRSGYRGPFPRAPAHDAAHLDDAASQHASHGRAADEAAPHLERVEDIAHR